MLPSYSPLFSLPQGILNWPWEVPQTHTLYVRKYLAAGLLQNCLQDTGKRKEWIKSKMEMGLLLRIKCSGLYCGSIVKRTFHPKSRFGVFLCVLTSIEKHPEGWFPFLFFFLSEKIYFSLPVKALLLFLFPWCFLISIPCSCILTCCKESVPGIPLSQGWIVVTSAAWLGPVAVLHPMSNLPVIGKTRHTAEGQSPTHCVGSKKLLKSRVSSAWGDLLLCWFMAQQKDSGQLGKVIIFLCFGKELAECAGNLCSKQHWPW